MISFVLFMVIKGVNRMKLKEDETPKPPSPEEILLMEIRDLLKKQS
jgi:large conductance mechanosensitive channel